MVTNLGGRGECRYHTVSEFHLKNDEPETTDSLDRAAYAAGLARLIVKCETPLVIGVYGSWGMGKSTLLNLIHEKLKPNGWQVVAFNAWQHQFDEHPAVAMAQAIAGTLKGKAQREARKLVTVCRVPTRIN